MIIRRKNNRDILDVHDAIHKEVKICGSYVVTLLVCTPIIDWYMVRLVVKSGHYKDTCYVEIGL